MNAILFCLALLGPDLPPDPFTVSDYDEGDVYFLRGAERRPHHGMRDAWVFNRALEWIDAGGALLCAPTQAPLPLTGRRQVSRWFSAKANELSDVDDETTRFVKKDAKAATDHASLPPFQFPIEQFPEALFEATEASPPWQFIVAVKGRSGPPLYASPWQEGPGKLSVDLLERYRGKGYRNHFAQLQFFVAVRTKDPAEEAAVTFRLRLRGVPAIVPCLPVVRTADRVRAEGAPLAAVVVDERGKRLGKESVSVEARIGNAAIPLSEGGDGVWKGTARDLPAGDPRAELVAAWKDAGRPALRTALEVHVTDGRFAGYDPGLRLLTHGGRPLGPLSGSYRGAPMFSDIGTPKETLVQGQEAWDAAKGNALGGQHFNFGGARYGFHGWESLTPKELDDDYAYLARCGWGIVHLCQGWWVWERLDAGGRLAPHGAEQLALVAATARRHGLRVLFAVSHYPLGKVSAPYAQYLEAGYKAADYRDPGAKFYAMFRGYLDQFSSVFRDETGILGFTAAGEGDPACGMTFVNAVHDALKARDPNHLVLGEPHHAMNRDPLYHVKEGWKPRLSGMRTYFIDRKPLEAVGAQFKLAGLGDLFMGEGIFWGYSGGPTETMRYRERIRETFSIGFAHRSPILLTWEARVAEDEHRVLDDVRRRIDWSKPFARSRVAIRAGRESLVDAGKMALARYEAAFSRIPLEYACVWEDGEIPRGTLAVLDARRPFAAPAFVSEGGALPDALKADMPLGLPAGFAANYSWSEDRRRLVAFLWRADAAGTTEAGRCTYADTTKVFDRDTAVDAWEVRCVRPGPVELCIFREEGDALVLVGRSGPADMKSPGPCRFALARPVAAKKGDLAGLYIPHEGTHVAAAEGGRVLFLEKEEPKPRVPLASWKEEPKTLDLRAFNSAEAAPRAAAGGLVLRNFPDAELKFLLFDLAEKKVVAEGPFRGTAEPGLPPSGRHFLLAVYD
jgi:hypothetical protein